MTEKEETVEVLEGEILKEKAPKTAKAQAVKRPKKNLVERTVLALIGKDGLPSVGKYLTKEIIAPTLKDLVGTALKSGIDMIVYGEQRPDTTRRTYSGGTRYATPQTNYSKAAHVSRVKSAEYVEDYVLAERNAALDVLNDMKHDIYEYGQISVADYKDLIGIETVYTDHNYGWTNLEGAVVTGTRGGFMIKFPPIIKL